MRIKTNASPTWSDRKDSMVSDSGENPRRPVKRPPKPAKFIYFLNGRLVKQIHVNRASNIAYIYDYLDKKEKMMLLSDFKKHRKRAYSPANVCRIIGRSKTQMKRYYKAGLIKRPTPTEGTTGGFQIKSYHSEDEIFELRRVLATIHRGRPRLDGKVTSSKVLTEQELRGKMGDALLLYVRKEDGTFVPVWSEETY